MTERRINPSKQIQGILTIPGDKSLSHRAVILGSLAEGETRVANFLTAEDCLNTVAACRQLGAAIDQTGTSLLINGCAKQGLKRPAQIIDCGNSGTSVRLLSGVLAGQPFSSVITGDEQIRRRPMRRIIEPLEKMGATIRGREGGLCPLEIHGGHLNAIDYQVPVASAQVKSCVLLAGLFTSGKTTVTLPAKSRDHTERMLQYFGACLSRPKAVQLAQDHWSVSTKEQVSIEGGAVLKGQTVNLPADISSAAFFIVAASLLPGSYLRLKNIGVNPTRTGFIDVLQRMGADITLVDTRLQSGEPVADINIKGSDTLQGRSICGPSLIPRLIDEIPILAVAAAAVRGETVIEDAAELRVKETDRISVLTEELSKIGIEITERPDGVVIQGGEIKGGRADSHGDHRLAMSLAIAGLLSEEGVSIQNPDCVNTSFPTFWECLEEVSH